MYEHRHQPLISRARFMWRLAFHLLLAVGLVLGSLGAGMIGYVYFEQLHWVDAFLNSAMLLGGMGPVDPPHTEGGKLFAGIYALYAGLVFLVTAALMLGPVLHRLLHKFHWGERP